MSTTLKPFPLLRYASLLGVQTTLLGFVALYLPRSTFLISDVPEQASSKDRPQHPFLKPLTADPILTLGWLCLGTFIVQAWWAGALRKIWVERDLARSTEAGGDEQRVKTSLSADGQRWTALKDATVSTLVASTAVHCVLVLFGAPLIEHFTKSYLLGLLLSILAIYPAVYTLGSPSLAQETQALVHRLEWIRLFAEFSHKNAYERAVVYPSVGSIVGAWLGAIPIALDWDRPWQAWPLTPAYFAFVGNLIASWASLGIDATLTLAEWDKKEVAESKNKVDERTNKGSRKKSKAKGVSVVNTD